MTYSLHSNADKAYVRALKLIKRYTELLDLHSIAKKAEEFYYLVSDKKELKGKRTETVVAAIIWLACKKDRVPYHMP